MVDTVCFQQRFRLAQPLPSKLHTLDAKADFKVRVAANEITWVSVSLPKLLFGRNTKLIENQQQLDEALAMVDAKLSSLGTKMDLERRFTRVDLCWQFKRRPTPFFLAHAPCNHPEIVAEGATFRNRYQITGLWWKSAPKLGATRRTRPIVIRMYAVQSKRRPTIEVVRVEIQLRLRKLPEKLNADHDKSRPVRSLDFGQCYAAYRATLRKFLPKHVPKLNHKDELLVLIERDYGIPVTSLLAQTGASRATIHRLRKRAAVGLSKNYRTNWNEMLPADRMPRAADPEFRPKVRVSK